MITLRQATVWMLIIMPLSGGIAESKRDAIGRDLILRIRPVRPVFGEGADITLQFSLKNVSQHPVLATREASLHDLIYLEIVDQHGNDVGWRGKIISRAYPAGFFVVLQPGQSVTFRSVISFSNGAGYEVRRPGTYRVRAEFSISPKQYFAPVADGAAIPDSPVRSNWAKLVIAEKTTKRKGSG